MAIAPNTDESQLFLLEAWVADNPGSRLFLRLARAYRQAQRPEEAAQVLKRGLAVSPQDVEARELLADILRESGDPAGAQEQLLSAARELGRHAGIFESLAGIWQEQGQAEQAQAARNLAEALSREPGSLEQNAPAPQPVAAAPEQAEPEPAPKAAAPYDWDDEPLEQEPEIPEVEAPSPAPAKEPVVKRLESLHQAALKRAAGST